MLCLLELHLERQTPDETGISLDGYLWSKSFAWAILYQRRGAQVNVTVSRSYLVPCISCGHAIGRAGGHDLCKQIFGRNDIREASKLVRTCAATCKTLISNVSRYMKDLSASLSFYICCEALLLDEI